MSNLTLRILSALILIPVILFYIFFTKHFVFTGFLIVISVLANLEFTGISFKEDIKNRIMSALFSGLLTFSVSFFNKFPHVLFFLMILIIPIFALIFMFSSRDLKNSYSKFSDTVPGVLYTGLFTGLIGLIFSLGDNGSLYVLTLLAGAFIGDTLAYFTGRAFGRKKLAKLISPGKTIAGSIGALVGSVSVCILAGYYVFLNLHWYETVFMGILLSVFCQTGDLFESFIKRANEIKDSGNVIPGHGGLLDRIDGLLFGAPVVYFFAIWNNGGW